MHSFWVIFICEYENNEEMMSDMVNRLNMKLIWVNILCNMRDLNKLSQLWKNIQNSSHFWASMPCKFLTFHYSTYNDCSSSILITLSRLTGMPASL